MSITSQITDAHAEYEQALSAWNASFDFMRILSQPEAPVASAAARAGEILTERGIIGALVLVASMGMRGELVGEEREIANLIIMAGVEAQDGR